MTDETEQSGRIRDPREKYMAKTRHKWPAMLFVWMAPTWTLGEHDQAARGKEHRQPSQAPPGLLLMGHNFKKYRTLLRRGNNFKLIFCDCFLWRGISLLLIENQHQIPWLQFEGTLSRLKTSSLFSEEMGICPVCYTNSSFPAQDCTSSCSKIQSGL